MKNNNTVIKRKSDLDQFYTKPELAEKLVNKVLSLDLAPEGEKIVFVEPSAGSGSFLKPLQEKKKKVLAYDISPAGEDIEEADFLDMGFVKASNTVYVTLGNPPFGKISSMAVKFFNKAAEFSDYICFILPRTFRKGSIHDKLNLTFKLVHDEDLPKNSFLLGETEYNVPCCFQIWKKQKKARSKTPEISFDFMEYTKEPSEADLAIRRVGGRTGALIVEGLEELSTESHYFIKLMDMSKEKFAKEYAKIKFGKLIQNTAGIKSLSKKELAKLIKRHFKV